MFAFVLNVIIIREHSLSLLIAVTSAKEKIMNAGAHMEFLYNCLMILVEKYTRRIKIMFFHIFLYQNNPDNVYRNLKMSLVM